VENSLKIFSDFANNAFNHISESIDVVKNTQIEIKDISEQNLEVVKNTTNALDSINTGVHNLTKGFEDTKKELLEIKEASLHFAREIKADIKSKQDELKNDIENFFNPIKAITINIEIYLRSWGSVIFYSTWISTIIIFTSLIRIKLVGLLLLSIFLFCYLLDNILVSQQIRQIASLVSVTVSMLLIICYVMRALIQQVTPRNKERRKYQTRTYKKAKKTPVHIIANSAGNCSESDSNSDEYD
jgi:hypothetical protein